MRHIGNVVYRQRYQGFESLRLRQDKKTPPFRRYFFILPSSKTVQNALWQTLVCRLGSKTSRFRKYNAAKSLRFPRRHEVARESLRLRHEILLARTKKCGLKKFQCRAVALCIILEKCFVFIGEGGLFHL